MKPQTINLIQTALKILGAALATHGSLKAAAIVNSEDMLGLIIGLGGIVWSFLSNRTKAIIQNAADSLPAGTVIPATTDAAPVAKVLTPEAATEFIRKS